jgi:NlpC/P60 family putative phage cell wall peptidase
LSADLIVAAARAYINTPWRHQARLKGVGVDCIGLLWCALRDAGIEVPDVADYARAPSGARLIQELESRFMRVHSTWQLADVLAFTWGDANPWHVGLVSGLAPPKIIHSYSHLGKVTEMRLDPAWRRRVHSCWRVPAAPG